MAADVPSRTPARQTPDVPAPGAHTANAADSRIDSTGTMLADTNADDFAPNMAGQRRAEPRRASRQQPTASGADRPPIGTIVKRPAVTSCLPLAVTARARYTPELEINF